MSRHTRTLSYTSQNTMANVARLPKKMPTASGLPPCWTAAMDRALCEMEASGEVPPRVMATVMKQKFPVLDPFAISLDAIERRIEMLEYQDNDYFKEGTAKAIAKAEANGFVLPPFDPSQYPIKEWPTKSDLEVLGDDSPMTGLLAFGTKNVGEDTGPRASKNMAGSKLSARDTYYGGRGNTSRMFRNARDLGTGRVHESTHTTSNITNSLKTPNTPLTPADQGVQYLRPSPNQALAGRALSPSNNSTSNDYTSHHNVASSKNDKNPLNRISNRTEAQSSNGTEGGNQVMLTRDSSSSLFYRSGKENATSGISNITTGTSILGREISGMSNALERRKAKIDARRVAQD